MNKEELRIGNIVQVDYDYYIVNSISATLCECLTTQDNDPHQIHIGNIEPIPLSPAILEKCGFEKDRKDFWRHNDFILRSEVDGSYTDVNSGTSIKYLHLLQNIFYFTNELQELQITL